MRAPDPSRRSPGPGFGAAALVCVALLAWSAPVTGAAAGDAVHGSEPSEAELGPEGRVPNRSYPASELFTKISPQMGERHHNQPSVIDGYLLLAGNGVHEFWDISNPYSPVLVSEFYSPHRSGEAESHQVSYAKSADGSLYLVTISGRGIDLWAIDDVDVREPRLLKALKLPNIDYGNLHNAVWGVAWQGDYIYVGASTSGLYVVDAADPVRARLVRVVPRSRLGGVAAGPLFALGNLLVITNPLNLSGIVTLDISDPTDPTLLDFVRPRGKSYVGWFYGRNAVLQTPYRTYDVTTNPRDIRLIGSFTTPASEYVSHGDGYLFLGGLRGGSEGIWKYDIGDPDKPRLIGRIPGRDTRWDDQFSVPIGNLVAISDDQNVGGYVGSYLAVHDTAPDTRAPAVDYVNPPDGAVDQALTSAIGLSFTDQIEFASVGAATLFVRPVGGAALAGKWGHSHTVVTFSPAEPLRADTAYEVVAAAGGVTDLVGNALAQEFRAEFRTRAEGLGELGGIGALAAVETGANAEFAASPTSEAHRYRWDFGDGAGAVGTSASHAYDAPGRYTVILSVLARDVLEAEWANLSGGVAVASDRPGHSGSGFADYPETAGANVKTRWRIERRDTGAADIEVRYANGDGANRFLDLVVNGNAVETVAFPGTGDWNVWATVTIDGIAFDAGENTLELVARNGAGPDVDFVSLTAAVVASYSGTQIVHRPLTANPPAHSATVVVTADGERVWAVNPDTDTVTAVDADDLEKAFESRVGRTPRTLAQAPDGTIWVVNEGSHDISVLDSGDGEVVDRIKLPFASMPYGVAFAPDGRAAYVTLQALGRLLRVNPATRTVVDSLALGPDADGVVPRPRGVAVDGTGGRVLVSRFVAPEAGGEVYDVDVVGGTMNLARTIGLAIDPGPDTPESGRGVPNYLGAPAISPDGADARVPSKKDNIGRGAGRDGLALTHESTVRTIVSRIDLAAEREDLAGRIDLDEHDTASAVAFSRLGDLVFVAIQGSNAVAVIDAYGGAQVGGIPTGAAPQGLALGDEERLYVQNFLGRSLSVFDVAGLLSGTGESVRLLAEIDLVENETLSAEVLRGKRIFYDASSSEMSLEGYISCASCHLDGGQDGRVWDFTDRGEGFRNTITLRGRGGTRLHGPVHWTGNFDEIQDFENNIRSHFGGSGFLSDDDFDRGTRSDPLGDAKAGLSPKLDALAAYVSSLTDVPTSPHRDAEGRLTAAGESGRRVFAEQGCGDCHGGAVFTDSAPGVLHDVGTAGAASGKRAGAPLTGFDTPTLKGVWATAPYLHDGSASTLAQAIKAHVNVSLSEDALRALVAYVRQIDELELSPRDIDTRGAGNDSPRGMWGDGETLWVTDYLDEKLYAYAMADGGRLPSRDIDALAAAGNSRPNGIWSDGEALWVADLWDGKLYAYRLADGSRNAGRDIALAARRPFGVWGDGETLWVGDKTNATRVYAYRASDGVRDTAREFVLRDWPTGELAQGLWSDGDVFFVLGFKTRRAYAYRDGARVPDRDVRVLRNSRPTGLWSDGEVLWVSEYQGAAKLLAHDLPVVSANASLTRLALAGMDIGSFSPTTTSYAGETTAALATVAAFPASGARVAIEPPDADPGSAGHQVALPSVETPIALTVTAADRETERTYDVSVVRTGTAVQRSVTLTADAPRVTEGTDATFTASVEPPPAEALEVAVAVDANGQFLSGTSPASVTFAAGEARAVLVVATEDDAVAEEDGSVTATLRAGDAYVVGDPASATVAIQDDDRPVTAAFAADTVPNSHDGTKFSVEFSFSEDMRGMSYLWVRHTLVGVTGGTLVGERRVPAGSNLRWELDIEPASWSADTTLTLRGGLELADGRTLSVGDAVTVPGQRAVSVTDTAATEGAAAAFTVRLDRAVVERAVVRYATSDGTATAGSDYEARVGRLEFLSGEIEKTLEVPTTNDAADEADETFTLTLRRPSANLRLTGTTATATIRDDDETPSVSVADAWTAEGAAVPFAVTLSSASGRQTMVDYATSDGTATAGSDFDAAAGTLTFAPGEIRLMVDVPTTDDDIEEDDETLTLTLTNPVALTLGDATAAGTIEDDDAAGPTAAFVADTVPNSHDGTAFSVELVFGEDIPGMSYVWVRDTLVGVTGGTLADQRRVSPPSNLRWELDIEPQAWDTDTTLTIAAELTLQDRRTLSAGDAVTVPGQRAVSVTDATAAEGAAASFTVTLDRAVIGQAAVEYATSDGTATTGSDYDARAGTLEFQSGEIEKTLEVPTTNDAADEDDETFTLTLSRPTANVRLSGTAATATIRDDDEAPSVGVADARAAEGAAVPFAVTLSTASGREATVDYATSDGTATAGSDFDAAAGTLTFAPGETRLTVDVPTTDDDIDEDDETLTLTLANPVALTLGDATAAGTIEDDDGVAGPTAEFEAATVPEAHDGATFSVTVAFSEDVAGMGYAWVRDTLVSVTGANATIARRVSPPSNLKWELDIEPEAWDTDATLTIAAGLDLPNGQTLSAGDAVTVPGQRAVSVADASAAEGASASFVVTLDRAATGTVRVDYATSDGTAEAGLDYSAVQGTLTFGAGETAHTVTVALLVDNTEEEAEKFTLTLSGPEGAARLSDATATGTIEDGGAPAQPTARFTSVPLEHDGATMFTAELEFSEEVDGLGWQWVMDSLVTATNGSVEVARRRSARVNLGWEIDVAPESTSMVTLTVVDGLALPDGRTLLGGAQATVPGPTPPTASVVGDLATLVWDSPRDGFGSPSASDYGVRVNGAPRTVTFASLSGHTLQLKLALPVGPDDVVTVGYLGSAMHPLADASGRLRSVPWDGVAAINLTGSEAEPEPGAMAGHARPADPVGSAALGTRVLDAANLGLTDLSDVGRLTALERLDLSRNAVSDLSPMVNLVALKDLDLSHNRIEDLRPLSALHALERLDLSGNRVVDTGPLGDLPHLTVLVLDGNAVTDIGPLTHLIRLEHLGLAGNAIAEVTALQDLPVLRRLDLTGNTVHDLSPLGDVGSLVWLALPGSPMTTTDETLGRLTKLRWVWMESAHGRTIR